MIRHKKVKEIDISPEEYQTLNEYEEVLCEHCGNKPMKVTITKTRRTHKCETCPAYWYVDVAKREMFGMDIYVSERVPNGN